MKQMIVAVVSLLLFLITINFAAAISITSPVFGVSQERTFDLELSSTQAVSCRYSTTFAKPFDEMDDFTTTGSQIHTLDGVELPSFGTEYDYIINCSSGSETAQIKLKADNANPSVSTTTVEPDKIVESPLETTLTVTTNEETSCKYDETADEYDAMVNFFSGSDTVKDNYKTNHEKTLTGLTDDKDYSFNVMCKDLSGRKTGLAKINFKVNTSAEPEIINFTPKHNSYTSEEGVVISITTNKNSFCKYGNETPPTEEGGNFNVEGTVHENTVQLSERTHTYYFKCTFEGPSELTAQTTFTIDKTPPVVLSVDDDQGLDDAPEEYTYYTNRLKARWKAEDNESNIKEYNYSIISGTETIVNWTTTTSDRVTERDLQLEDGRKYVFKVKAKNNAGLWSEAKESNGVTVDISLNVEQACKNEVEDGDESDIDCGGSCPAKCVLEKDCNANLDCVSGYCSEGKCAKGSCNDGIQNQDETTVDCGGSCEKCLTGDNCKENNDCKSNICTEEICVSEGPCYNGEQDGTETDIDCGGICTLKGQLCYKGKKCKVDEDCTSKTCGIDGKCSARNDRDNDAVVDSKDNCPKSHNPQQGDIDDDGLGDKCDDDSDNDGMTDEWEEKYGLDLLNAADAELDNDGDSLSNLKEFQLQTNPLLSDSDGDGYNDAEEVAKGTNPTDAESKPKGSSVAKFFLWMLVLLAIAVVGGYLYYRRVTAPMRETKRDLEKRKQEDAVLPQQPTQPVQKQPDERKYKPEQIYKPTPPPPRRHASRVSDEVLEDHAKLSGEEVFEKLKKHTRRRRR